MWTSVQGALAAVVFATVTSYAVANAGRQKQGLRFRGMFERSTTLILGAGASAPFGFPLATGLHDAIVSGIDGLEAHARNNRFLPPTSAFNAPYFKDGGTIGLASYLQSPMARDLLPAKLAAPTAGESMVRLRDDLKRATHDSIDRFIADNPQHEFIGKCLLVMHIVLKMYRYDEHERLLLRDLSARNICDRRNWYHQLINHLRSGASDAAELNRNLLRVVTFNYEPSLQHALSASFAGTERHAGADWRSIVRVHHVNGAPPELPAVLTDAGRFIVESARHLHLVDEPPHAAIKQVRAEVRGSIIDSDRVFVLGFHFDPANVKAIGLADNPYKSRMFALNFSGHIGVAQRILALGVPPANIRSGSPAAPLHIDQAIDEGFFEQ